MKRISWSDHHFFAVGWLWSLMKIVHWVLFTTFFPLKYWGNVQRLGCQSAAWALWFSIGDCPREVWKNIMCLHRYMAPLQQRSWVDPIEHEELLKQRNVAVLCFVYDRSSMGFMVWFALFWDLATESQGDRMTSEMQVRQLSADLQHARAVALDEPATLEAGGWLRISGGSWD